jgi:ceramide glucosyltransferase
MVNDDVTDMSSRLGTSPAMNFAILSAAAFLAGTFALHAVSIGIALKRCRTRTQLMPAPVPSPAISLIRPVCGLDNFIEVTLASSFDLDYPEYEIIFCAAHARDPVVPVVQRLISAHPDERARLLIGDERISANPKLNNCFKGWNAAAHEWIILADSNVLMPRDYLTRLMATWRDDTGLVCSPPSGSCPEGFWAEVECAFLNAHQARWQYVSDSIGNGFAQGKTMLWRRDVLENAGGMRLLGLEAAEDAASTKVVRNAGLRVCLTDAPFAQPLGYRSALDIWRRQVRWAQLRRASFPRVYAPEIFAGGQWPLASAGFLAMEAGWPVAATVLALATVWYGAEMILARVAGWPLSVAYPVYAITRDLLLPLLWVNGWLGSNFVWRGNPMSSVQPSEAPRT